MKKTKKIIGKLNFILLILNINTYTLLLLLKLNSNGSITNIINNIIDKITVIY